MDLGNLRLTATGLVIFLTVNEPMNMGASLRHVTHFGQSGRRVLEHDVRPCIRYGVNVVLKSTKSGCHCLCAC